MEEKEKSAMPLISIYQDDSQPDASPPMACSCDMQPAERLQIILFAVLIMAIMGSLFFGLYYLAQKLGWI